MGGLSPTALLPEAASLHTKSKADFNLKLYCLLGAGTGSVSVFIRAPVPSSFLRPPPCSQVAQQLPEYGVLFYNVAREKKPVVGELVIGVCAKGVMVYEVKDGLRSTSQTFHWRETSSISSTVSLAGFIYVWVYL